MPGSLQNSKWKKVQGTNSDALEFHGALPTARLSSRTLLGEHPWLVQRTLPRLQNFARTTTESTSAVDIEDSARQVARQPAGATGAGAAVVTGAAGSSGAGLAGVAGAAGATGFELLGQGTGQTSGVASAASI